MNRKPEKGDTIYNTLTGETWKCHHTRDNVCYSQADESKDNRCFIYWFESDKDFNQIHVIIENGELKL